LSDEPGGFVEGPAGNIKHHLKRLVPGRVAWGVTWGPRAAGALVYARGDLDTVPRAGICAVGAGQPASLPL